MTTDRQLWFSTDRGETRSMISGPFVFASDVASHIAVALGVPVEYHSHVRLFLSCFTPLLPHEELDGLLGDAYSLPPFQPESRVLHVGIPPSIRGYTTANTHLAQNGDLAAPNAPSRMNGAHYARSDTHHDTTTAKEPETPGVAAHPPPPSLRHPNNLAARYYQSFHRANQPIASSSPPGPQKYSPYARHVRFDDAPSAAVSHSPPPPPQQPTVTPPMYTATFKRPNGAPHARSHEHRPPHQPTTSAATDRQHAVHRDTDLEAERTRLHQQQFLREEREDEPMPQQPRPHHYHDGGGCDVAAATHKMLSPPRRSSSNSSSADRNSRSSPPAAARHESWLVDVVVSHPPGALRDAADVEGPGGSTTLSSFATFAQKSSAFSSSTDKGADAAVLGTSSATPAAAAGVKSSVVSYRALLAKFQTLADTVCVEKQQHMNNSSPTTPPNMSSSQDLPLPLLRVVLRSVLYYDDEFNEFVLLTPKTISRLADADRIQLYVVVPAVPKPPPPPQLQRAGAQPSSKKETHNSRGRIQARGDDEHTSQQAAKHYRDAHSRSPVRELASTALPGSTYYSTVTKVRAPQQQQRAPPVAMIESEKKKTPQQPSSTPPPADPLPVEPIVTPPPPPPRVVDRVVAHPVATAAPPPPPATPAPPSLSEKNAAAAAKSAAAILEAEIKSLLDASRKTVTIARCDNLWAEQETTLEVFLAASAARARIMDLELQNVIRRTEEAMGPSQRALAALLASKHNHVSSSLDEATQPQQVVDPYDTWSSAEDFYKIDPYTASGIIRQAVSNAYPRYQTVASNANEEATIRTWLTGKVLEAWDRQQQGTFSRAALESASARLKEEDEAREVQRAAQEKRDVEAREALYRAEAERLEENRRAQREAEAAVKRAAEEEDQQRRGAGEQKAQADLLAKEQRDNEAKAAAAAEQQRISDQLAADAEKAAAELRAATAQREADEAAAAAAEEFAAAMQRAADERALFAAAEEKTAAEKAAADRRAAEEQALQAQRAAEEQKRAAKAEEARAAEEKAAEAQRAAEQRAAEQREAELREEALLASLRSAAEKLAAVKATAEVLVAEQRAAELRSLANHPNVEQPHSEDPPLKTPPTSRPLTPTHGRIVAKVSKDDINALAKAFDFEPWQVKSLVIKHSGQMPAVVSELQDMSSSRASDLKSVCQGVALTYGRVEQLATIREMLEISTGAVTDAVLATHLNQAKGDARAVLHSIIDDEASHELPQHVQVQLGLDKLGAQMDEVRRREESELDQQLKVAPQSTTSVEPDTTTTSSAALQHSDDADIKQSVAKFTAAEALRIPSAHDNNATHPSEPMNTRLSDVSLPTAPSPAPTATTTTSPEAHRRGDENNDSGVFSIEDDDDEEDGDDADGEGNVEESESPVGSTPAAAEAAKEVEDDSPSAAASSSAAVWMTAIVRPIVRDTVNKYLATLS
ncbi:Hypothetical protein, putative [Bodo saltans]|uniref:Uncharacterized protein n=1 Tax=Bodo saltans TaxID=75058 RepID=A0A0S4J036_BODSA|nr:Hypothetical protein, putative [Bodo saltans]|eukprot:CUG39160.1 Hypothetical protein, putative [Bodo saltans]